MIIVTTKTGKEFKYTGNIIVFQNDYGIIQVIWNEEHTYDEEWYTWNSNGVDWFYREDLVSIKGS